MVLTTKTSYKVNETKRKPRESLHKRWEPASPFRNYWNVIMLFITIYNLILIPFRLAFEYVSYLVIIDYTMDILLAVDFYLKSYKFSFLYEGIVHTQSDKIKEHYKKDKLRYYADVFSCIPFDILAVISINSGAVSTTLIPLLRIPKLFRTIHIVGLIDNLNQGVQQLHIIKDISVMKLFELLGGVILVAHWAGCFFYLTSWVGMDRGKCNNLSKSMIIGTELGQPMTQFAECIWKNTWIQKQIRDYLLPPDGGDIPSRYLRSLNWALPTLVVVVIGDVYPINVSETLYCFLWMYAGVTINAVIIGNIANLVADLETEQSQFVRRVDKIKSYIHLNRIPIEVANRVEHYLDYLWSSKQGINESHILVDLPHSLKVAVSNSLRLEFIQACPIFDSCEDSILRDIAHSLDSQLYSTEDIVVQEGDVGAEMYIVSSGSVNVVSSSGAIYANLGKGAFFGESALFFSQRRTASIIADDFSELLILRKDVFEMILEAHYHDFDDMVQSFKIQQEKNRSRNSAVAQNVTNAQYHGSKLNRILDESMQVKISQKNNLNPIFFSNSNFRAFWDFSTVIGILCSISLVPFSMAFVDKTKGFIIGHRGLLVFDYFLDGFFLANIFFCHRFTFISMGREIKDTDLIKNHYRKTNFIIDVVGVLPFDLFIFASNYKYLPFFRINRLIRFLRLRQSLKTLDRYFSKWRLRISVAVTKLVHAFIYLVLINHYFACIWVCIYRYIENFDPFTWGGKDQLSNEGRSIEDRYIRAFYFVITSLSTVGYGDIRPWKNIETVFELIVIITSACMFAGIIGQFTGFIQYLDSSGENSFKTKLNKLRNYMSYREFPRDLQQAILNHHIFLWQKRRCQDEEDITQDLPLPIRMEVALFVIKHIIDIMPPLCHTSPSIKKRLALLLKPQLCAAGSNIYHYGDSGSAIYFIASGVIRRTIDIEKIDVTDSCEVIKMDFWQKYPSDSDGIMTRGEYFGEQVLTSRTNLQKDEIDSVSYSELYILSTEDLDRLLFHCTGATRVNIIRDLLRLSPSEDIWISLKKRDNNFGSHYSVIDSKLEHKIKGDDYVRKSLIEHLLTLCCSDSKAKKYQKKKKKCSCSAHKQQIRYDKQVG